MRSYTYIGIGFGSACLPFVPFWHPPKTKHLSLVSPACRPSLLFFPFLFPSGLPSPVLSQSLFVSPSLLVSLPPGLPARVLGRLQMLLSASLGLPGVVLSRLSVGSCGPSSPCSPDVPPPQYPPPRFPPLSSQYVAPPSPPRPLGQLIGYFERHLHARGTGGRGELSRVDLDFDCRMTRCIDNKSVENENNKIKTTTKPPRRHFEVHFTGHWWHADPI